MQTQTKTSALALRISLHVFIPRETGNTASVAACRTVSASFCLSVSHVSHFYHLALSLLLRPSVNTIVSRITTKMKSYQEQPAFTVCQAYLRHIHINSITVPVIQQLILISVWRFSILWTLLSPKVADIFGCCCSSVSQLLLAFCTGVDLALLVPLSLIHI